MLLLTAVGLLVVGLGVHGQDPTHKPPQPVPSPCPTDINPYWEDFTEVGFEDFYLGCLLTNMNDPETRNNTYTWWEAKEFCENAGGYLVQVETEVEHQQLSWHFLTHWNWVGERYYWIGLEDFETYGTWIWNHTGVKADFVMWANGAWAEPDQQCVHLNYDAYREWEPQNCDENGHHHNTVKYSALCEADPKFRWPHPTKPTTQPFTPSEAMEPVPEDVVITIMQKFEDYYNDNEMDLVGDLYAEDCYVTVNGGVEAGGIFTGHNNEEVAGFLDMLRNELGGTNMNLTVKTVEGNVHYDSWTADNGSGTCKATWQKISGDWKMIADEITFVPKKGGYTDNGPVAAKDEAWKKLEWADGLGA